ncbi:MmgE/PrpD family protein [Budviciaceae bacterium BWR-B9]|uniref:MmgE/PrpD family protein n=1 Tax=Limnobaculum allomyrinae TaxID=2791986 RepID=A0ABS1IQ43_9GAMM|nr:MULTISPECIES: MmgE/PrpD family protein [Limnobaculum]MBK5143886.1 MmgE/PrpD family protein [Limnobaculum allomyrinae]MBV7691544.1 MmgE/PrpD family protein [Limnobaculum sp. M2-1]
MRKDVQKKLADFIVDCRDESIAERLMTDMKYRVIDWLGCAVAGVHYPQSDIARRVFTGSGGLEEATVIGTGARYPAAMAAMVNGVIGHVSELDDGHRKAIGHPGSVTLPVALALGESLNVSGQAFLKALIIGYDVYIRLGQTVNPSHYAYWHTTGTCGTFAATATAASLMQLTPEQTCNALGISATLASGLVASFGSHAKALNVGHACQNGVYAALLAKEGFTGSPSAMMGEKGYVMATSDAESLPYFDRLSAPELLSDTAFYKVYASCGHTNSPLDAIFSLIKEYAPDVKKIISIKVETYRISVSLTAVLKVKNEDEAKFSLPYCMAVAMLFGQVSLAEFQPEVLQAPDVLELAKKIEVVESEQATARFPKRQAHVTVFMEDGQVYQCEVMDSTDVADFAMLEKKFLNLTNNVDRQASEEVLVFIKQMDKSAGIVPLLSYLRKI